MANDTRASSLNGGEEAAPITNLLARVRSRLPVKRPGI